MPDNALGLLILGIAAGVLSGMFGIGGGVVIVPVLATLFAFELRNAIATSLGALMMPVAILAVIAYYRAGMLRVMTAVFVSVGLFSGVALGATIQDALSLGNLEVLYGIFLLYNSWRFLEPRKLLKLVSGPTTVPDPVMNAPWYLLLGVGFTAGIISGMFGVGGGLVIVPLLVALLHFDQKVAVGTSLGALLPPTTIGAVINDYNQGLLNVGAAALVAVGLLFGALAGARITISLPSKTIKQLYGIFLLLVGLRFLLQL
ncbi:MAG: sulfite exporter TauE/SafE family protein [Anaerolineae bacterium]